MAGELQRVPETSTDLEKLKHAITINQIIARFRDSAVSIDHGDLAGLSDDDHPHYYNSARLATVLGDYYTIVSANATFAPISHTHSASQIVDFSEAVDDRVAALLVAGDNVSLSYDDVGNALTINATAGGASVAGSWSFDTGTSAADPGNKQISFNSATLASVTAIYVNDTSNQNFDASTILGFLSAGNRIYIQQKNTAAKAALFEVSGTPTDNTGWWTIPVTVVDSGTLMDNSADCAVVFVLSSSASAAVVRHAGASWGSSSALVASSCADVDVRVAATGTITGVYVFTQGGTGSCVIDIWKDSYANFPPTVADSITASAKPTITSGTKYSDTTLTGWTTSVTAGDVLRFHIDSTSTFTNITIYLTVA